MWLEYLCPSNRKNTVVNLTSNLTASYRPISNLVESCSTHETIVSLQAHLVHHIPKAHDTIMSRSNLIRVHHTFFFRDSIYLLLYREGTELYWKGMACSFRHCLHIAMHCLLYSLEKVRLYGCLKWSFTPINMGNDCTNSLQRLTIRK